jgi:hypothetical protein
MSTVVSDRPNRLRETIRAPNLLPTREHCQQTRVVFRLCIRGSGMWGFPRACGASLGHDVGDRSFRSSYNKGGTPTQIATAVPKSWTSTQSSRSLLFS